MTANDANIIIAVIINIFYWISMPSNHLNSANSPSNLVIHIEECFLNSTKRPLKLNIFGIIT